MARQILITGGAGFIGSHLADELLRSGYRVRALDNLSQQVHGTSGGRPRYLDPDVELIEGDVRDSAAVRAALRGVDAVYHFAAAVGVGQSMYEIEHYTSVNNGGTAVLLQALIERPVERLIVASSMSLYGEGRYRDPEGNISTGLERTVEQLRRHDWEVRNVRQQELIPIATPENKPPTLASVYALSKFDQERLCLMIGRAYSIATVALRFFNVYGTRQALSNPYTGVLAIFGSRLINNRPPVIFEDGLQKRDFVHVSDVAQACRLALEVPDAAGRAINIGSGNAYTVLEIARQMASALDKDHIEPEISHKYRVGDIRHCFADIRLARRLLRYEPRVQLADGLAELSEWLPGQASEDLVPHARTELDRRGLSI